MNEVFLLVDRYDREEPESELLVLTLVGSRLTAVLDDNQRLECDVLECDVVELRNALDALVSAELGRLQAA